MAIKANDDYDIHYLKAFSDPDRTSRKREVFLAQLDSLLD